MDGEAHLTLQAFLFSRHSQGKGDLEQEVHQLLWLPAYLAAGLLVLELHLPHAWSALPTRPPL
jgi:hypothetical protein